MTARADSVREASLDTPSFENFCRQEYPGIVRGLSFFLSSPDLAAEAADEAFARALERWDSVGRMANPAGWVYRVGQNWARRRMWRARRERELLQRKAAGERFASSQEDSYSDPDLVFALSQLPAKQRSVVVLRFFLGYSEQQTAEALEIAPGTVKSRSARALEQLRHQLQETHHARERDEWTTR